MIRLLTKQEVVAHLLQLSPEDRYTRFCLAASDDYIRNYVERDVGFFYGEVETQYPKSPVNENGWTNDIYYPPYSLAIAVIHIVHDINTRSLEIALSVLPQAKGRGFAKKLMYFAQGMATVYQAEKMIISGLSQNSPMINLARSCGYDVKSAQGEFEGECSTIGADIKSIVANNIKLFKLLLGK